MFRTKFQAGGASVDLVEGLGDFIAKSNEKSMALSPALLAKIANDSKPRSALTIGAFMLVLFPPLLMRGFSRRGNSAAPKGIFHDRQS